MRRRHTRHPHPLRARSAPHRGVYTMPEARALCCISGHLVRLSEQAVTVLADSMSPCVSLPAGLGSVSAVSQRGTLFAPSISAKHPPQRSSLAGRTHSKGEYIKKTSILSIVRRGPTYQ